MITPSACTPRAELNGQSTRLDRMDTRLEKVDGRLDHIERDVKGLREEIPRLVTDAVGSRGTRTLCLNPPATQA